MALTLDGHPLFAGADRAALAPLLGTIKVSRVERGELLGRPGAMRPSLLLVLDGFLHSYDLTDEGGRVLFEVIGPGGVDGALGVLGGLPHFTEAASPGRVAAIDHRELERLFECSRAVASNLVTALVLRVARREHQLSAAALKDPSKRIAKQLLTLADTIGEGDGDAAKLRLHVTHQQIADMLAIRRETATIHLHQLAATRAVILDPNGLRVSRKRLRAIVEGRLPVAHP